MSLKIHITLFTFVTIFLAGWSTATLMSNEDSNNELDGQRQYEKEWKIQQIKSQFETIFSQIKPHNGNQNKIEDRKESDKNTRINEIRGRFETIFNRSV